MVMMRRIMLDIAANSSILDGYWQTPRYFPPLSIGAYNMMAPLQRQATIMAGETQGNPATPMGNWASNPYL